MVLYADLTKDTSQKISTGYIQHCCHVVKRNKGYTRQILFNIYYNIVNYQETVPSFILTTVYRNNHLYLTSCINTLLYLLLSYRSFEIQIY